MEQPRYPTLFSVKETASYLRVSVAKVYKMFANGELPRSKVGGRTLVRRADIDALVANNLIGGRRNAGVFE